MSPHDSTGATKEGEWLVGKLHWSKNEGEDLVRHSLYRRKSHTKIRVHVDHFSMPVVLVQDVALLNIGRDTICMEQLLQVVAGLHAILKAAQCLQA
jgi:hypothetical protein